MKDMKVRQGGRLAFTIDKGSEDYVTASFIFGNETTPNQSITEPFVDGIATFEIGSPYTDVVARYSYQINANFKAGSPDIYPSVDDCNGDCELPTFEVCEALQI